MTVLAHTFTKPQTKDMLILICLLSLLHLDFALGECLTDGKVDILTTHRQAAEQNIVIVASVPENVSSAITLFDLTNCWPNMNYIITNNSAGVPGMFKVTNGRLALEDNLPADKRKLFDYEKFKFFDVMINVTNETDASDVVQLTVSIPLYDVNDEFPVFTNWPRPFITTLSQNALPGTIVYYVTATDADSNPDLVFNIDEVTLPDQTFANVRFTFLREISSNPNEAVYTIITTGTMGFQPNLDYTIKISVQDRNSDIGSQQTSDTIVVRIGYRPPQFFEQSYKGQIYESTSPTTLNWVLETGSSNKLGVQVLQFQQYALTFQLLQQDGTPSQMFYIQAENGVQRIGSRAYIDYEALKVVSLIIEVTEAVTGLSTSVQLIINILDVNDNSAKFIAARYYVAIREDINVGSSLVTVSATDVDDGINGQLVFSVVNNSNFDMITRNINNIYTGELIVKRPFDYEMNPSAMQVFVMASDKGTPALTSQVEVGLVLQNVNDNAPTIVSMTTDININENTMVNTIVTVILAFDVDGDAVKFYFEGKTANSEIFSITETNGEISLRSSIPPDRDLYILKVIVVDDDTCCTIKTGSRTSTATLTVNIVDANLNKPIFTNCRMYDDIASVKEKAPIGTHVIQVNAVDSDRGQNGVVLYSIVTPDPYSASEIFSIDDNTGNIFVKGLITRGKYGFVQVTVVGRNPALFPLMESRCTFRVRIIDINDNPPVFLQSLIEISVSISNLPPALIYVMGATDKDEGENANITYSFSVNSDATLSVFSLNSITGAIRLAKPLNLPSYTLNVTATDNGKDPGPLTANATVRIIANFDTSRPPEWIKQSSNSSIFEVTESLQRDFVITNLSCKSNVANQALEIRVYDYGETVVTDSRNFYIVPVMESEIKTVYLALRTALDFEEKQEYKIYLVCQSIGRVVLHADLLELTVKVLDENDEIPEFVGLDSNGRYSAAVTENAVPGTSIGLVSVIDHDTVLEFKIKSFALVGPNKDLFHLNYLSNNSAEIVTTSLLMLDREILSDYYVEITAMDGAPASPPSVNNPSLPNIVSRYISISVTDVNDNAPYFKLPLYVFNISENAYINYLVQAVTADDPDEIDQKLGLEYRFIDGNVNNAFFVTPVTGEIRLRNKLDFENPQKPKIYNLTMIAFDQNQLHSTTTVVQIVILDENDNKPVFNPSQYVLRNVVTEEDRSITPENPLFLVTVTATFADVAHPETSLRYYLYSTSQPGIDQLFTVDAVSGNVSLIGVLDRDIPPYFQTITVEARDEVIYSRSGFANILIYCKDVNDNFPVFDGQFLQGSVPENLQNTFVMSVIATDRDEGNNSIVKYAVAKTQPNATLSSMFSVNEYGNIYTTDNVTLLDRESVEQVFLTVCAYDMGTIPLSSYATLTITIIDVNDQAPVFEYPIYSASISEKQTSGKILTILAIDLDSDPRNRQLVFSIVGKPEETKFFMVQSTDSTAEIYLAQPIDYETDPHHINITLHVTDNAPGQSSTTNVQITVLDFNDNSPVFSTAEQSVTCLEDVPIGFRLCPFIATDADEGINAEIVYSIVPASDPGNVFSIDPNTGEVIISKPLDREVEETVTITILATDKGEQPLSSTGTLHLTIGDINDNAPHFRENYQPVLLGNVSNSNTVVELIHAIDVDTLQYGPPFGFKLPTPCSELACAYFSLIVNLAGDGGNGTATVRTSSTFDKEKMQIYRLPIVMWDMGGKPGSLTATDTLTITIS